MRSNEFKYQAVCLYEACLQFVLSRPRGFPFSSAKRTALRLVGASVGPRVVIYPDVWIMPGRGLHVEEDVDLAKGVLITTSGGVSIGARTLIGYGAKILSSNHNIPAAGSGKNIFESGHTSSPVRIGKDVWIGANAIILPGVTVGDQAVVAAASVVNRDVEPGALVAGVPAVVKRVVDS